MPFGQDQKTLAPDIFCCVDVGFSFMLLGYSWDVGSCEIACLDGLRVMYDSLYWVVRVCPVSAGFPDGHEVLVVGGHVCPASAGVFLKVAVVSCFPRDGEQGTVWSWLPLGLSSPAIRPMVNAGRGALDPCAGTTEGPLASPWWDSFYLGGWNQACSGTW